ncbi:hypothetical protein [Cellulomonas sp. HZM]|uniref:phage tail protein n=1 Tax=Cellulomonas sp. HZM TaxID=1454010 RepID=UPI000493142E|nr:hypothetical protein [Cellulomonas sp. HZM]
MSSTTTTLEFLLTATDRASETFRKVGEASEKTSSKMSKLKAAGAIGLAGLAAGAIKFGKDSVDAFADAQASQTRLEDAYRKYPALADTQISKLRELNSALQQKTGYDDDDTAAAQAALAQYKLSGDQIARLTPLLQDYAAKTGRDLPAAAKVVGKAMLGQGKALKDVGVNFTDTKSLAGNFSQVMIELNDKVGGFAENGVDQAAKKSKILAANFGDLQETVGSKLQPALTKVTEAGIKVLDWLTNTPGAMQGVAIGLGVMAVAWAAMTLAASPWLAIGAGIALAIGGVILVVKNWGKIGPWLSAQWDKVWGAIKGAFETGYKAVKGALGKVGDVVKKVFSYTPIGLITTHFGAIVDFFKGIPGKARSALAAFGGVIKKVFSYTPVGLVVTNFGKIVTFVKGIPGKIRRGLGDLKDLLLNAGGDVMRGLYNGISSKVQAVVDKVASVATAIKDKFTGLFDMHSPSRVTHGWGKNLIAGLINGLDASRDKARSAIERVVDRIKSTKGLQGESALLKYVRAEAKKLDDAWKQYDATVAKYEKAKDRLAGLRSDKAAMVSSVKGGITGQLDLSKGITAATEATSTTTTDQYGYEHTTTTKAKPAKATFASVAGTVSSLAKKAKKFAGLLSKMAKVGIPAGLVQEVAGMGIEEGTQVADALANGTAAEVKGLRKSWATLQKYSGDAGVTVGGQAYNAKIGSAKTKAKSAKAKVKKARKITDEDAKAIAKALAKVQIKNEVHVAATIGVDRRTSAKIVQTGNAELKRSGSSGTIAPRAV